VTSKEEHSSSSDLKLLPARNRAAMLLALESLVAPNTHNRRLGLERLLAIDAHRRSPLAAVVLAQRIEEPDIEIRISILRALTEILKPMKRHKRPDSQVRHWLIHALSQMRTREVYAILQVMAHDSNERDCVCTILNACSFAGETMKRILSDRKVEMSVRVAAAEAVGCVGFLDALPALRALDRRISDLALDHEQDSLLPIHKAEVEELLPVVRDALQAFEEIRN
jgi:HEAT repeat protein